MFLVQGDLTLPQWATTTDGLDWLDEGQGGWFARIIKC